MNSELFTLTLQDLEPLLANAKCPCHIINPSKTRIILWKEVKGETTTYYLRIGIQKFISYPLTDKNNEVYWRFQGYEKVDLEAKVNQSDSITKFQSRQVKTAAINHGKSTNHSGQSESTSH